MRHNAQDVNPYRTMLVVVSDIRPCGDARFSCLVTLSLPPVVT